MPPANILVVDDEKNILLTLSQLLELEGYAPVTAANGKDALDLIGSRPVDAVLLDVKLPDIDGLQVLDKMLALRPGLPVLMMSGDSTIETAVKATQKGARDFFEKPIVRARVLVALRNALELSATKGELETLRDDSGRFEMVGTSPAMQKLYALIQKAAPSEGRVLITGENGTGKELIAQALHQNSKRRAQPFVKLNCAAVPHELIESELFGHEKGSFTGALTTRRGRFELAHGGTLFLDEVGDMPPGMQAKLLRVLQEGELERVGGQEAIKVDVRVIAATNKDLEAEVTRRRFREDLYFRLNVVQIQAPALRHRLEDVPALVEQFLGQAAKANGRRPMKLSPEAMTRLKEHDFPGNVRELRNLIERLAILCEGPVITGQEAETLLPRKRRLTPLEGEQQPSTDPASLLPVGGTHLPETQPAAKAQVDAVRAPQRFRADRTFRDQVEDAEREIILGALAHTRDNATEAAKLLDLERGHFYKKMKALGLKRVGGETSPADQG
ncbi:MAG: sigma-54 dependent transcriptional regulator [Myxococcaceae bacterium]|nr:sigma-54 dependent transcriptional regulator [Myxococcaceae bacterium]